ncbi:MAG: hypothetical protein Q7L19_16420 [Pseudohongiella sp.]|nr:hypothetical protein [Pseudohongiella sp.]
MTERNLTLLRQFKQPFNGEGEPYDAGCKCAIEEFLALSHETFPGLGACVVTNWVLAGLDVSAQMVDRLFQISSTNPSIICSKSVVFDEKNQMRKGKGVRSGFLVGLRLLGFFRTRNAVHLWQGTASSYACILISFSKWRSSHFIHLNYRN